ncbi:MAG: hypothetical protein KJI69_05575 [Patescibacteria group bacterium]|nr:hypothetical protein [Patescibacteria group bacterium]
MTKFKLNARAFGGIGLFLIVAILLVPLYIVALEQGLGDIPSNVIQIEEGVRTPLPQNPLAFGIGALIILFVLIFLIRVQLSRQKR